jgi:hypothetical protein
MSGEPILTRVSGMPLKSPRPDVKVIQPPYANHPLETPSASASAASTSHLGAPLPPHSIERIVAGLTPDSAARCRRE